MTTWYPDTCDCVIESYNTPQAKHLRRCARHAAHAPADVLAENQNKNVVVAPLVEAAIPFDFSIDDAGKLTISSPDPQAATMISSPDVSVVVVADTPVI